MNKSGWQDWARRFSGIFIAFSLYYRSMNENISEKANSNGHLVHNRISILNTFISGQKNTVSAFRWFQLTGDHAAFWKEQGIPGVFNSRSCHKAQFIKMEVVPVLYYLLFVSPELIHSIWQKIPFWWIFVWWKSTSQWWWIRRRNLHQNIGERLFVFLMSVPGTNWTRIWWVEATQSIL